MSNTLAIYCRGHSGLPLNSAAAPVAGPANQGLYVADAAIESIANSTKNHYSNGLPMNLLGRMVVGPNTPVAYWDQGVPYTATGNVATGAGPATHYSQGLPFNAAGQIVSSAGIQSEDGDDDHCD